MAYPEPVAARVLACAAAETEMMATMGYLVRQALLYDPIVDGESPAADHVTLIVDRLFASP